VICLIKPQDTAWFVPTVAMSTSIAGFCEHVYLITRFYNMSKNYPLTGFLAFIACAKVVCQQAAGAHMIRHAHLPVRKSTHIPLATAGWSLGTAVDSLLAMAVFWQLVRLKVVFTSSKNIVRKFLLCTVISGGLTALYGILLLILVTRNDRQAFIVISTHLGKIYGITVFANLALVQRLKRRFPLDLRASRGIDGSVRLPVSLFTFSATETTDHSDCSDSRAQPKVTR